MEWSSTGMIFQRNFKLQNLRLGIFKRSISSVNLSSYRNMIFNHIFLWLCSKTLLLTVQLVPQKPEFVHLSTSVIMTTLQFRDLNPPLRFECTLNWTKIWKRHMMSSSENSYHQVFFCKHNFPFDSLHCWHQDELRQQVALKHLLPLIVEPRCPQTLCFAVPRKVTTEQPVVHRVKRQVK